MTSAPDSATQNRCKDVLGVFEIDPLRDSRWEDFIRTHPKASVFHTTSWLTALRETYQYQPAVLCTSPPNDPLTAGLVYCRVKSWLTGNRVVSLPFSDHCEPLLDTIQERNAILLALKASVQAHHSNYVEIRPATEVFDGWSTFAPCRTYFQHVIDVSKGCDALFHSFHKDCVQRKIRRAERESLSYHVGNSEPLLSTFYRLFVTTRYRHGLPPQPFAWFRNLAASFGERLQVRVAAYRGNPIAAILTLEHRNTIVYKYGGSDARMHRLGGIALLFWRTIQDAHSRGLTSFDLGRSDPDNLGLIRFKNRLGADATIVSYQRFPELPEEGASKQWVRRTARALLKSSPKWSLIPMGKLLYPHVG